MAKIRKLNVFNDPIYGFISTPDKLLFTLISHPYFQRLRRISQTGLSYLVYPGAHHTRFHHALGCMHLMTKAIQTLRWKRITITPEEEKGLLCAILLHDIGHGPFSHALEGVLVKGLGHEKLSLALMQHLNHQFDGQLETAIAIFKGEYPKPFMNQLISSQLDMDRLDYLKRDSFYAGVTEGNINSERLIAMLNVVEGYLVIEEKGIYAVEEFLMARRFMYWQVYLHKTSLVAEQLLVRIMERARELLHQGKLEEKNNTLAFFLQKNTFLSFEGNVLEQFARLDDIDVLSALKSWQFHHDFVLAKLCTMLLNRELLHITLKKKPPKLQKMAEKLETVARTYKISPEAASYFVFQGEIANKTYSKNQHTLKILKANGKLIDILKESDHLSPKILSKAITKYYSCYPKT